ncbi:glycosyltransferase family 2 protein [Nitratireductor sp.]|uniref:glycosyltransferase family 2 protein n=1 Tax=Nitratireductor sp. TaxID=1872084 RepID=UPI0025E85E39|nr:glycosyltransferase family 2 protein [Nitratireductor sp.]
MKPKRPVSVSVLMPVYNCEVYLSEAIKSIQDQTFKDFEIIIVNDGSTDKTREIVDLFAEADPRIIPLHTENQGIVDALNHGAQYASGKYLARMDGDDISYAHRFALQVKALDDDDEIVAVSNSIVVIDESGYPKHGGINIAENRVSDLYSVPAREHYLVHPFLMMRRSAFDQVGGYRHILHSEDAELYFRLEEVGKLKNLPQVLGEYRVHTGSVSGKDAQNGRIQSVSAQLAAISARRRRSEREDILLTKDFASEMKSHAYDIISLCQWCIKTLSLTREESEWLRAASVVKYLQHEHWRPYTISNEDAVRIKNFVKTVDSTTIGEEATKDVLRHYLWVIKTKWKWRHCDNNFSVLKDLISPSVVWRAGMIAAKRRSARRFNRLVKSIQRRLA